MCKKVIVQPYPSTLSSYGGTSQMSHAVKGLYGATVAVCSGEKRKLPEALTLEDAKRIRVMGDIPMELVNEVMMTITDPAAMLGPEVSRLS